MSCFVFFWVWVSAWGSGFSSLPLDVLLPRSVPLPRANQDPGEPQQRVWLGIFVGPAVTLTP